jgi:hypothetical protein
MSRKTKTPKKDWFTLTKILAYITTALVIFVTGFACWIVVETGDTSPLIYLIPSVEILATAIWGLYIWRGRTEYKIRANKELLEFLIEKNVEVTPDMINAFNTLE